MTDQWKQISGLYDAALRLPENERADYLKKHSPNEVMRLEVESLLAHEHSGEQLLESPAMDVAAKMMAEQTPLLEIGQTLGHYEIISLLGKGGMGEVYRAKDTKLDRDAAIKVLPIEFAIDAVRVERFQREARLLASFNHPNIASIYGMEESGGINFLVIELIEGETLAEKLKRGAISIDKSLKLALQIAEGLEAAHEKGIIHRDLKPANIKVTPEGKIKILDFGLAKAFALDHEESKPSDSPTISAAATRQGVILGTAAYMSPEQARGKAVDRRADIWAFGVVLFEMLTGRTLFAGEDFTSTLARVLESQPDFSILTPNLHPRIRLLLERCLEKEARNRYSSISDARVDIQKVMTDPSSILVQPVVTTESRMRLRNILLWVAASVIVTAIIAVVAVWKLMPHEPRQVMRFDYDLPEGQLLSRGTGSLAVSPDGKKFVYSTTKGLYIRSVDDLTAKLIAGTEGNTDKPLFSPDGKSILYYSVDDFKLKKIFVSGGAPVTLCTMSNPRGIWWGADNTIVYGQYPGDMMRISANGGTPQSLVKMKSEYLFSPQILPDGESVLYTAYTSRAQYRTMVQSPKLKEPKELFQGGGAWYLPTGHIVYRMPNNRNLFAVEFDPERLEVKGSPVPIVENLRDFAVSDMGTLVYIPETGSGSTRPELGRTLVWVNRQGIEEKLDAAPNYYQYPKISPDGTRVALTIIEKNGNSNIWIWDLALKILMRLTFDNRSDFPLWTLDGNRIAFYSTPIVYWKASNGTGEIEQIGSVPSRLIIPMSWSADGKTIVTQEVDGTFNVDIGTLSIKGDHARKLLLKEDYVEGDPRVSPDGRWLAYTSIESGKHEVYVRPFPDVEKGKWQVSSSGGNSPLWSPDGRELFYLTGQSTADTAMRVAVETQPTFKSGKPELLFKSTNIGFYPTDVIPWDIHPDGKRFLMIKQPQNAASPEAATPQRIVIVMNWFEELKQRVPKK